MTRATTSPWNSNNRYLKLLRRLEISDQTFMIAIAVVVGVVVGLGSLAFDFALEFSSHLFWHLIPEWFGEGCHWCIVFIPAVGGLLLAPFIKAFPKEAMTDGVPATMEAVALKNGFMRWSNALLRIVMSALTLGSGGSAGSEGPIIQIGAALASGVGQVIRVSGNRLRVITACGAGAGLASIFNAPIAGVLFSLEVVLGEFNVHTFSPIVISSVIATAFSRAFIHHEPLLQLPPFSVSSPWEISLYALLGIIAGLVSITFTQTMHGVEHIFKHQVRLPAYFKPALGGLAVGFMGMFYPQIFGYSYVPISRAIDGQIILSTLVILVLLKIVATAFTLGSGGSGGVLCPSLFLGATLGSACGALFHQWLPDIAVSQGAYGVVGMGAMLGAVVQAPMTAIIMVFEMTNEYQVILPMMTSCILAALVHKAALKGSIYSLSLARKGIDIEAGREMGILSSLRVRDIMEPSNAIVSFAASYQEVFEALLQNKGNYLYIVDENDDLEGVISFSDMKEFVFEEDLRDLVVARDVANHDLVYVKPDESLASSINKFSFIDMEQLPVVEVRNGSRKLCGIITRSRLMKAYHQEMAKRVFIQNGPQDMGTTTLKEEELEEDEEQAWSAAEAKIKARSFVSG